MDRVLLKKMIVVHLFKKFLVSHKSPQFVPILSQMSPFHTLLFYFSKINFNIILSSLPRSSEWSLPFSLSNQNVVRISHLPHACSMPLPSHPL
jgi:hypothetical protein